MIGTHRTTVSTTADSNGRWVTRVVYHGELLELAAGDLATDGVGVVAPEMGPAFDGTPTATNIIAANVYERLSEALENLDIVDATLAGSSWEVS